VAGSFSLLVSLVLSVPIASSARPLVAAAGPVEVPPLGVSGVPVGEVARPSELPKDVLLEPPSDAVPVKESWDARLKRERAAAANPTVVGFDAKLSVEDPTARTSHGTTYHNLDGTWTTVIDDHAVNFLSNGVWEKIDPRVVPTRAGTWVTKANDFVLTFSSRAIKFASGEESVSWVPAGVGLPEPEVSEDGLTVTYREVWPGVDLRYRLETDMVIEEIVIRDAASVPVDGSFAFDVSGPGVKADDNGSLTFEGALGEDVVFGGVEVFDADGLPISTPDDVALTVGDRRVNGAGTVDLLSVVVDPAWAAKLPADAFPLVVDPTLAFGASIRVATSSNGGTCATNPLCDTARVGNLYTTVNRFWRTGVGFSYEAYLPTSTVASQLTAASLYMAYVSGATA